MNALSFLQPVAKFSVFAVLVFVGSLEAQQAAQQTDWPSFRGPDRTGVAPDSDLLESWPDEGPKLIWETSGAGRGYAGIVTAGDKIFTLGDGLSTASDKDEYLVCFSRADGKQLWTLKTGPPWTKGQASWQSSRRNADG